MRWKHFSIDDGYLLHKGRVCVPLDLDTHGAKSYMSVMIVQVQVIQVFERPMHSHKGNFTGQDYTKMLKIMFYIAKSAKLIRQSASR